MRAQNDTFVPTFLFGMERSGTTLLSMMVGAHSRIAVPLATTGMWIHFGQQISSNGKFETKEQLNDLIDDILGHERIELWDAELDRDRILENLPLGDYGAVICRVQAEYARKKDKAYWANIDIATLDQMDLVNQWVPDARFVHIVRDGRDVALSHQTMPYGAGNIAECARAWKMRIGTSVKMGRILGPDRYHVLRFEDLVLDSETVLRKLCRFLGVAFDPSMLRYSEMADDKIPDSRRWLWPEISKPPQNAKVDRWRHAMSRSQRIVFEDVAGDSLREWGYETLEPLPKSLSAHILGLWYFLTQGGRLGRLQRRFGLGRQSLLERAAKKQDPI